MTHSTTPRTVTEETITDVAVERWQAETGREAILDGDGRTFAALRAERLGDGDPAPAGAADTDAEPARKRKSAA